MMNNKTTFVTIEFFKGVINEVRVYSTPKEADQAENCWLKENKIKSDEDREIRAQNGTEFYQFECQLKTDT